jgi:hypothetical protein
MSQKTLERLEYLRKSRGTWRAWCAETCMPGSVGGGWKRAQKSNALTAYPTPERVGPKVRTKPHKSQLSSSREASWKRGSTARNSCDFSPGSPQLSWSVFVQQRRHREEEQNNP